MAENNQGLVETMTGAMSKAVEKLSSRKVGIALVGMWLISTTQVPEARLHVFWLCVVALATQMVQDIVEVLATGKDLPETNGSGNGKKIVVVNQTGSEGFSTEAVEKALVKSMAASSPSFRPKPIVSAPGEILIPSGLPSAVPPAPGIE